MNSSTSQVAPGLQRNVLLFVIIPMLLLSGIAVRVGLYVATEYVNDNLRTELDLIGRAIRIPLSDAMTNNDMATVNTHLDSVFTIGRINGAAVYNTNGEMVAATGTIEKDLSDSNMANLVVTTGEQKDSYRTSEGKAFFSHFFPIINRSGQIHGLLQINRKASDFEESFSALSTKAWLVWLLIAGISLLVMWKGYQHAIGNAVNRLISSMREVASGNRQHRADVSGPTEIREIAKGLNLMLDKIKLSEEETALEQDKKLLAEKQLKEQESLALIGHLVSGIAHELGAPLSVISGRTERLKRRNRPAEEEKELIAIDGQVTRLISMVEQLQAFAYKPEVNFEKIDLQDLISQAMRRLSYELPLDDIDRCVSQHIQNDVIYADKIRLELAVVNLLRNALQACVSSVIISAEVKHHHVIIAITDDGPGIAEGSSLDALIKPFYSTKPQGEGTGLGLAIVDQVMQEHGGKLMLENNKNTGLCATLTFAQKRKE
ncbi:sensor histidine kinase [Alteromonas hispanica]|uniref:histidine kinase n=1 Tax=Alteromonas hispanica TaxID=315421 RepID=A0A6L9MW57_9ALTE|nr:HAMP domain-containing sensor histidine kinase [Alteromonas hispanica]NDW22153.1 HAMP domain-containing protein [Alteromonas hispanica]